MFENVHEIILKVTRDCNLRCQYCYIPNKDDYAGERMSFAVYKQLLDRVLSDRARSRRSSSRKKLKIVFHGGEPTLLGLKQFTRFVEYARKKVSPVEFSIQTNLTTITREWVRLFKRYQISPGISIDGIKTKENELRKHGYDFLEKVALLQKYRSRFGVLMVLTRNNVHRFRENVLAFIDYFKIKTIKANYVENTQVPSFCSPEVSAQEMFEHVFLPTMDILFQQGRLVEHNTEVLLAKYLTSILYAKDPKKEAAQTNCLAKFCGGGNSIVEVEPDGNVLFCGRWNKANDVNYLGNVLKPADPFGIVSYHKVFQLQLQKIQDIRAKGCDQCSAADICHYGCLAFSYVKYQGQVQIREDLVCEHMRKVIEYLQQHTAQVLYAYANAKSREVIGQDGSYLISFAPIYENYVPREELPAGLRWKIFKGKRYVELKKQAVRA